MKRSAEFPWYVSALALYSPLALLAYNLGEIRFVDALRSIVASLLLGNLLLFVFFFVLKDWKKSGVLTSFFLLLFFSYGHVFDMGLKSPVFGDSFRHRYLIAAYVFLIGIILWRFYKFFQSRELILFIKVISVALLFFPCYSIISFEYENWSLAQKLVLPPVPLEEIGNKDASTYPDVYFIVLDTYGRSDVLNQYFSFDNRKMLSSLEKRGFYVAECGRSNYPFTAFSLSASLNMNYLPELGITRQLSHYINLPFQELIQNNRVEATFDELGYTTYAFETGYSWSEVRKSDDFIDFSSPGINNFESLLMRSTAGRALDDAGLLKPYHLSNDRRQYQMIVYEINELKKLPANPGPKFVFAHLMIPHPPFVFGPSGEERIISPDVNKEAIPEYSADYYVRGYRNQAAYISDQVIEIVDEILAHSKKPPIIIIQGDHGPWKVKEKARGRMTILSAYYFPDPKPELYSTLTPVNDFRMIFRNYFQVPLENLPNLSYFTTESYMYDLKQYTESCK